MISIKLWTLLSKSFTYLYYQILDFVHERRKTFQCNICSKSFTSFHSTVLQNRCVFAVDKFFSLLTILAPLKPQGSIFQNEFLTPDYHIEMHRKLVLAWFLKGGVVIKNGALMELIRYWIRIHFQIDK